MEQNYVTATLCIVTTHSLGLLKLRLDDRRVGLSVLARI